MLAICTLLVLIAGCQIHLHYHAPGSPEATLSVEIESTGELPSADPELEAWLDGVLDPPEVTAE